MGTRNPQFGATVQYVESDTAPALSPEKIKYIQKVIGKFLFMARAVDNTLLHALNELARAASKGTTKTLEATTYLRNYSASNPRPRIQYRASDMILYVDSDAAFQYANKHVVEQEATTIWATMMDSFLMHRLKP